MQMNNNLSRTTSEQQQQQSKTKPQMQEQLSSPLSQVLKTDFGNCENCELKVKLSEL